MAVLQNDVVRVTARMQLHGTDDQLNVYQTRFMDAGPVTDATYAWAMAQWLDAIYDCINEHIVNSVQYVDILLYNVTQDRPMASSAWPTMDWGALDANDLPWGNAFLVSLDTGVKNVKGRKYYGGLPTSDIGDGGEWVAALVTLFACVLLKMAGNQFYNNTNFHPGVWSPGVSEWRSFITATSDIIPAYQRRRRPGHGG